MGIITPKILKRYVIVAWTWFLIVYSRKLCFYNLFHFKRGDIELVLKSNFGCPGAIIWKHLSGYLSMESPWTRKSVFANTVEPVLGDPWFGRPLILGDHNPRHGSFITIKYLAWATTSQTRPATGSFGLTNDGFTCYERPDHATRGNFRQ